MPTSAPIAERGANCWRRARADRLAPIVDAAAYYTALAGALEQARKTIFVVGWDIDGRLRLRRDERGEGPTLRAFLDQLARHNPQLQIYLLGWDYALVYALERQWLPLYDLGLRTHRRIHFHLDDAHPPGASQHQKVVVIDDQLAFAGGIDLTQRRWDTPDHDARDGRRRTRDGRPFAPFHDLQLAVSGPVARALGELVRERWRRATGKEAADPASGDGRQDLWPEALQPLARDLTVAVARTEPWSEVREIEQLYLDGIAAARRTIYIENQFLTSSAITEALARRLGQPKGPEVVIVGPRRAGGWLESATMDVLRRRMVTRLRQADSAGRLRLYYPSLGQGRPDVFVHSKAMIVDDGSLRIGSANLSTRSMALDSECDLLVEAEDRDDVCRAIRHFRAELLAEHLGLDQPDEVHAAVEHGSLIGAIERLQRPGERTLVPLEVEVPGWLDRLIPEPAPFDPPAPLEPRLLFEQLVPEEIGHGSRRALLWRAAVLVMLAAGLVLLWQQPTLRQWIDRALQLAQAAGEQWWAPLAATGLLGLAATLLVPLTLLLIGAGVIFGISGAAFGLLGALLAAIGGFAMGRKSPRQWVRRAAGPRLHRIGRALARGGVRGVVAARMLPVAPFGAVNLVAGSSRIKTSEFIIGTALGLLPGALALALFGRQLALALRQPDLANKGLALSIAVAIVGLALVLRRWVVPRRRVTGDDRGQR